jgi:colanic acid biosynthesis glycosyl transferase WcaI
VGPPLLSLACHLVRTSNRIGGIGRRGVTLTAPNWRARRVVIAGVNYWPEVTGIAPYTTGLAQHLAARGAEVVVLTAMPSYPKWRVFDEYRGTLRGRGLENGVDVCRFRTYVPIRQSAVRRAGYELSYLAHALTHGPLGVAPDAVVGVVPTLSGGLLARLEAQRYRRPYGLILQDRMGAAAEQSGISGGSRVAATAGMLEGSLARGATRVGVISEGFRADLERAGVQSRRIVHLPNWSHVRAATESRAHTRARLGWPSGSQIVLHTGNMGLKQGLEHLLAAARLAVFEHPRARFVLMGDGSQRQALEALATNLPNVEFRDLVDETTYPNVLAAADVLLVNERASIVGMSLPSKLTSYFAVGRPVVAAVSLNGATAAEVSRAGAALIVPAEDPSSLLAALLRLQGSPELAAKLGAAGAAFAEAELSRTACLARLEAFIDDLATEPH